MEPDTFFVGVLSFDYAQPVCPAGSVAFMPNSPICDDGAERKDSKQIQNIQKNAHLCNPTDNEKKNERTMILAGSCGVKGLAGGSRGGSRQSGDYLPGNSLSNSSTSTELWRLNFA